MSLLGNWHRVIWRGRRVIKTPNLWVCLIFSCWIWSHWCSVFLYGSAILGLLLVTRKGLSKICLLKAAINDSCTQNWDDLHHYQFFLQRRLTHTSPSYPSVTFCHHLHFRKMQGDFGLKTPKSEDIYAGMKWKLTSQFILYLSIILQEPCFTSFHVLVFFKWQTKPTLFSLQVSCKRRIS